LKLSQLEIMVFFLFYRGSPDGGMGAILFVGKVSRLIQVFTLSFGGFSTTQVGYYNILLVGYLGIPPTVSTWRGGHTRFDPFKKVLGFFSAPAVACLGGGWARQRLMGGI